MHKVSVSVPAVSTNVGPGYDVLGLALNFRNVVEMSLRTDDQLTVDVRGEGKGLLPENYYHPAMQAAIKLFQRLEQAPVGLAVRAHSAIPLDVGLSARATMVVGGLVGANNLVGSPFSHDKLIEMAAAMTGQPELVATAMRGGLGICSHGSTGLLYRAIEITPMRVVLAVPNLPEYQRRLRSDLPGKIDMADVVYNIGHTALLIEALRDGDYKLLQHALDDRLHEPYRREQISAYPAVVRAAQEAGAAAVALCGAGPAMMAFAAFNHQLIEEAMHDAFLAAGIEARTWSVGIDLQGVVISVVE